MERTHAVVWSRITADGASLHQKNSHIDDDEMSDSCNQTTACIFHRRGSGKYPRNCYRLSIAADKSTPSLAGTILERALSAGNLCVSLVRYLHPEWLRTCVLPVWLCGSGRLFHNNRLKNMNEDKFLGVQLQLWGMWCPLPASTHALNCVSVGTLCCLGCESAYPHCIMLPGCSLLSVDLHHQTDCYKYHCTSVPVILIAPHTGSRYHCGTTSMLSSRLGLHCGMDT